MTSTGGAPPASCPGAASQRKRDRWTIRASAGWGALWGLAIGFGPLARAVLGAHHAHLRGVVAWFVVDAGLASLFGLLGALLAVVSLSLFQDAYAATGRRFKNPGWAAALAAGPAIVISYTAIAVALYWQTYGSSSLAMARRYELVVVETADLITLFVLVCVGFSLRLASISRRPPVGICAAFLAIVTVAQAASLPAGLPPIAPAADSRRGLERLAAPQSVPPLLFVGIDALNWQILDPLLDRGRLPGFRRLMADGQRGETEALWPPYWSAAAWSSIVTGFSRDEVGVFEDLAIEVPGLPVVQMPIQPDFWLNPVYGWRRILAAADIVRPMHPPRSLLRRAPFWELLSQAGVKTSVVRLPFTFPPRGQGDYVVSNAVGRNHWRELGVWIAGASGIAAPPDEAGRLFDFYRSDPANFDQVLDKYFTLPDPARISPEARDRIDDLRGAIRIDLQSLNASTHVMAGHPDVHLAGVYFGGFDTACHALWTYRFPNEGGGGVRPGDAEALGPLLDQYAEFLDAAVQQLMTASGVPVNVMIVSDHGYKHEWHDPHGFFLAAGPSVPRASEPIRVSYYDVVPTILALEGFRQTDAMRGTALFAPVY